MCILYNGVALIVIPDCIEAVAFYAKIVIAAHVDVEEQIQSLKSVVVHILLGAVVINSVVVGKPKYMLQILPLKPHLFQKIVLFLCKKHFVNKINFPLPVETKFIIISL